MHSTKCAGIESIQADVGDADDWNGKVIMANTSTISEEKISKSIENTYTWYDKLNLSYCCHGKALQTLQVEVKIIKTDWLFRKQGYFSNNNDFLKLIDYLD